MHPPWAVKSPIRAAGWPPIRTVKEPRTTTSGGPTHTARSPTRVLLKIEAGANVNPDATGRSSPLLVRIYQLKTLTGFNRSDFFSLYQDDNKALAADLVQKEEFTLRPGDQRALDFEPKPETQALAAIAAFRSLDSARWRATVTLAPHSTNSIVVRLTTNQLDMSVEKRGGEGAPP